MKIQVLAFFMLAMVAISGCDDSNSLDQGVKFKMKATTSGSQINPSGRTSGTSYTFEKAMVGVRKVEFENDDDDDNDDDFEIEFKGRYVVDLIAGTSNPEFGISQIDPGLYNEIEIELGQFLEGGNSVFVALTYQPSSGDPVKVEFSTKTLLEIEIEYSKGFEMKPDVLSNILVLVDLDKLLSSVDLSQAKVDSDGVIRINDSSNTTLAQKIRSNFKDSCKSGRDDDDDDKWDDD
ncbi:MAG: hypothetical protein MUE95_09865 [Cyclobacteriaceae bacterium]|nr:hypothetical protein [Cyclobacteriaceae bacterium]